MGIFTTILIQLKSYVDQWKKAIQSQWDVSPEMAFKGAQLFLLMYLYGLQPKITSGYRSIEKQQELYNRWLAGDKTIHSPAKPGTSPHQKKIALDIWCNNPSAGDYIAHQIGLKTGHSFGDYVHYQLSA